MEKAIDDRKDQHLTLLAWGNTPAEQLGSLGPSPAQVINVRTPYSHPPADDGEDAGK